MAFFSLVSSLELQSILPAGLHWSVPDRFLTTAIVTLAVGAIFFEVFSAWKRPSSQLPRRVALLCSSLRVISLALMVLALFEIASLKNDHSKKPHRIALLIDHSASMNVNETTSPVLKMEGSQTRDDRAQFVSELLKKEWSSQKRIPPQIESFHFGKGLLPLGGPLHPFENRSDFRSALQQLQNENRGSRPFSAIVVISDGLFTDLEDVQSPLFDQREYVPPVSTVSVANEEIRDLSLVKPTVPEFAFVENSTDFVVTVKTSGFQDRASTLTLLEDGKSVASQRVLLAQDGEQELRFRYAPDKIGDFVYELRIDALDGEATTENNRLFFVVRILRDKIRILHVSGRPDWDVRSLRTLLKRNPNVELLSYYILRDAEDVTQDDRNAPMSLIAFPTEDLFRKELGSFDLVIMQNFDLGMHGRYYEDLGKYVESGGALAIVGGDMGLATGDFRHPAIAARLPVDGRSPAPLLEESFFPRLTETGRRHPISAWLTAAESGEGELELPALDTFNNSTLTPYASKIGALSLLENPNHRGRDGKASPLLSVAEPGKGRTLVFSTGTAWRWGFAPNLSLVEGVRPFDQIWLHAIRWLIRDESAKRLQIESKHKTYDVGYPIELTLRSLGPTYQPEASVDVDWSLNLLSDLSTDSHQLRSGKWKTNELGESQESIEDLPKGAYRIIATRTAQDEAGNEPSNTVKKEKRLAKDHQPASQVFVVGSTNEELSELAGKGGFGRMQAIAESTDGRFFTWKKVEDSLSISIPLAAPTSTNTSRSNQRPLWNHWLFATLLLLSLGSEWMLRRKFGLS